MVLLQDSGSDNSLFLFPHTDLKKWKKTEIWAVIKYFIKKGMKTKEIHLNFQNTLRDSAVSYSIVAKWTSKFKFDQESLDVIHVVDSQKLLLPQKLSQKSIKWSWRFVDWKCKRLLKL